jgi:hypothetical protein
MEQATEANFCTMGRSGSTVVLDRAVAEEVMITGDLHGHRENFERILKTADLDHHPGRHLVLQEVCHGGPVYPQNGGCMSHQLLEEIARLVIDYPDRVHFLLGNHELAEVSDYPIQKNRRMLNLVFRIGMQHRYGASTAKVREAYGSFLRSCPLAIRLPGGVFLSHSIPERADQRAFDPGLFKRSLKAAEYQRHEGPLFDMVWGRDYRPKRWALACSLTDTSPARMAISCPTSIRSSSIAAAPTRATSLCPRTGNAVRRRLLSGSRDWSEGEKRRELRRHERRKRRRTTKTQRHEGGKDKTRKAQAAIPL